MMKETVRVVFSDDAVYVDEVLKRLPLKALRNQLGHDDASALQWHSNSGSGVIEYTDREPVPFNDVSVVQPYLDEWRAEPEQPEALALGSYLDAITMGPQDEHIMALKTAWEEVKRRHSVKSINARAKTLSESKADAAEKPTAKRRLMEQILNDHNVAAGERAQSPHEIREQERLRLLAAAKRKSA